MERWCQRTTRRGVSEFELEDNLKDEDGSNVMYLVSRVTSQGNYGFSITELGFYIMQLGF